MVAEGVERESQLAFLEAEGCAAAQGYLICQPLPNDEFVPWLLKARKPKRRPVKKPAAAK